MADGGVGRLTDLVLAAVPGADPAALRAAASSLAAATTAAELGTARAAWDSALAEVAAVSGTDPRGLLVAAVRPYLPDLPGLEQGLSQALALLPVDGWRPRVPLGPADVGLDLPAALALPAAAGPASLGLLPPDGASLVLAAGPVRGGGTITVTTQPHPRFTGAVGVRLGPVGVTAYAIMERPPGQDLSLLVLIGARFTPGIQVGFGFALGGVGGLVGINRRVDTDALRRRLADGSAADALFPGSPTRDTPALLRALGEFFPPQPGSVVLGPTLRLTFLEALVHLDLGVVVELPSGRVVVLGRGEVELPPGVPLVHLRVDVLGEIDPARKLVAVAAMLVDSRALGIFRVTGGAALQQSYGSPPFTVFSVGGFFPGFDPAPAVVPHLDRVGLEPDLPIPAGLTVSAHGYLAITSNTVQAGIDLRVGIDAAVLSAMGFLTVDAICQFRPFHFHADVSVGFEIDATIFSGGATLRGSIDGPGPVVIAGTISVDLLIDDLEWSDSFTIGSRVTQAVPAVPSLAAEVAGTVVPANLRAAGGGDDEAVLAARAAREGEALLLPRGTLSWEQQLVPLDTPVQRFQGRPLAGAPGLGSLSVAPTAATAGAAPRDWFAPGLFLDRTGSQALAMPPYDLLPSGVSVAMPLQRGPVVDEDTTHREVYKGLAPPATLLAWPDARGLALLRADERGAPSEVRDRAPLVSVRQEEWGVRGSWPVADAGSRTAAFATARATGQTALPLADAAVDASGVLV